MKSKKVLFIVQNLSVPFDRRVWMEATSLQKAGYEITVICPSTKMNPKLFEEESNITIIRFPLPFEGRSIYGIFLEYAWSLISISLITWVLSIGKRFHVIHLANPPDFLFLGALPVKLFRGAKIIFDQHDLCPEVWETKKPNQKKVIFTLLKIFEKLSYLFADHVIATNESYRNIAMARGKLDSEKISIVRSSPRSDFKNKNPHLTRSCSSDVQLVYLGTMGSQEGIDILLEAISILNTDSILTIKLDLIGDGPERTELMKMAQALGIAEICNFHGRISDYELRSVICNSDIAINPDRPGKFNNISSMNKIIEYMALGVPIVQFSSIEGKFTAGESAIEVATPTASALAASIESLRKDKEKRSSMQISGLARFEMLKWESQEKTLIGAYAALCKEIDS